MPFSPCIPYCNCGAELDVEGYHLLTCKLGEDRDGRRDE